MLAGLPAACAAKGAPTPAAVTAASSAPNRSSTKLTVPTRLGGTLFYFPSAPADKAAITSWAPLGDAAPKSLFTLNGADALSSATFSPDGKHVAWVASDFEAGTTVLYVANVDGSSKRVLLKEADPYCVEPNWSGASKLITRPAAQPSASTIDVATAGLTPFATPVEGCHVLMSADGSTVAFSLGPAITLANGDGAGRRYVPRLGADGGPTHRRSYDPGSLSADGRQLALFVQTGDAPDGDVARGLEMNEIVDTATGETKTLPVAGDLHQAFFLPTGGVVARIKGSAGIVIALLGPDLQLVTQAPEPPALASMVLLGYGG